VCDSLACFGLACIRRNLKDLGGVVEHELADLKVSRPKFEFLPELFDNMSCGDDVVTLLD
jgi:hypothetical protein